MSAYFFAALFRKILIFCVCGLVIRIQPRNNVAGNGPDKIQDCVVKCLDFCLSFFHKMCDNIKQRSLYDRIFSTPELKVQVRFSDEYLSVVRRHCCCHRRRRWRWRCRKLFTFSCSSPEPLGQFKICSNEGSRPFPRGNNYEVFQMKGLAQEEIITK